MIGSIITCFSHPSIAVILNAIFLIIIIITGALLGSTLRTGKPGVEADQTLVRKHRMIGVGSAFICLPFIASFLHLNYDSLLLPLRTTPAATYIEQLFMLVSLSGIASYLGYGLLDNIASKVLQSQFNDLDQEQKATKHNVDALMEENKKIKANEKKIGLELLYIKAKSAVETGQRFSDKKEQTSEDKVAAQKKYNDAIKLLNEGLSQINPDEDYETYDRFLVLKAYAVKRIGDFPEALAIVKKLLEKDKCNPILLYNTGCYLLLSKQHKDHDEVKQFIIKALTVDTIKAEHKNSQEKLIEKVLAKLDEDIKDLFDDEELNNIRDMTDKKGKK